MIREWSSVKDRAEPCERGGAPLIALLDKDVGDVYEAEASCRLAARSTDLADLRLNLPGCQRRLSAMPPGGAYAAPRRVRAPVGRDEAVRVARADQGGAAVVHARLHTASPLEYRKKPLPAWRVELADGAGTAVWVDVTRGAVVARRNRVWRVYDFLWSLHIMDYRGRDDFHSPWMVVGAALVLATVVSGAVIWGVRVRRRWA